MYMYDRDLSSQCIFKYCYFVLYMHLYTCNSNFVIDSNSCFFFVVNNPPSVNPDGGDDRIEYVTEGSSITLTCTRDNNNAGGDLYQWIHPNGQMTPGAPSDSPVQVTLNNINRNEDGVYICQGSRDGMLDSALKNNVTLNVQCELPVLLHILYCFF